MHASELQRDLAAFETRLREAYVRPPTAAVAEAHVQAMLAEADAIAATAVVDAPLTRTRASRSRWVALRRLALVPLAVLVAGGGLAMAGVRPPEPISDVLESVGIDVPGTDEEAADEEAADDGREGKSPGDSAARDRSDREAPAASNQGGSNAANDGPTPGAEQASGNAGEGQKTAEQARSGQTPPDAPGRSEDHPAPQGNGTPPEDPGHPGHGKPDSPPGQSDSASQEHGGGTAAKPDKAPKPDKVKPEK